MWDNTSKEDEDKKEEEDNGTSLLSFSSSHTIPVHNGERGRNTTRISNDKV